VNLFRTKSVEHIEEDDRGEGSDGGVGRLRRHLSARHLVGFGIGVVIGHSRVGARSTAAAAPG
jgi:APA family basic amino acid/polyamine antiporter